MQFKARKRGVILIITLWLLAALSLLALGLAYRLKLEGRIARYRHTRREMLELARGAVAVARARIERAPREVTFYGQSWAVPILLREESFADLAAGVGNRFRVEAIVLDELGKLNVNSASRARLMDVPNVDEHISGAIVDWRDADNIPVDFGAEARYYRSLSPAIQCKNDSLESIWELGLLKGVSARLVVGSPESHLAMPDDITWEFRPESLTDYLTVYGDGHVNINTASFAVLSAIPGIEDDLAQQIVAFRIGPDAVERTADDNPIEDFQELEQIAHVTEFAILQLYANCVLNSDVFRVKVKVADLKRGAVLFLDVDLRRGENEMETVAWRER